MLEFKRPPACFPPERGRGLPEVTQLAGMSWSLPGGGGEFMNTSVSISHFQVVASQFPTGEPSFPPSQSTRFGRGTPGSCLQGWAYDQVWLQ